MVIYEPKIWRKTACVYEPKICIKMHILQLYMNPKYADKIQAKITWLSAQMQKLQVKDMVFFTQSFFSTQTEPKYSVSLKFRLHNLSCYNSISIAAAQL